MGKPTGRVTYTFGRPPGAATRITRKKANEIAASGFSPLDIMQNNMEFWFTCAKKLERRLSTISETPDKEERKKMFALIQRLLHAREQAQICAVDAAPYVHPKLQAIAFSSDRRDHGPDDLASLTDEELATIVVRGQLEDHSAQHRGPETIDGEATTIETE